MAYSICYENCGSFKSDKYYKNKNMSRIYPLIIASAITGLLLIHPIRVAVMEFLIPGDKEVTTQATDDFLENIKEGQPISDAFADFCIQIVENA